MSKILPVIALALAAPVASAATITLQGTVRDFCAPDIAQPSAPDSPISKAPSPAWSPGW